jgi:hypothetical protein
MGWQLYGANAGWAAFFNVLQLYLTNFPGWRPRQHLHLESTGAGRSQLYFYGDDATATAARVSKLWQIWLDKRFPRVAAKEPPNTCKS